MPVTIRDAHLPPLVGRAMYWYSRKLTYNQVVSKIRRVPDYSNYSLNDIRNAASQGLRNYRAGSALKGFSKVSDNGRVGRYTGQAASGRFQAAPQTIGTAMGLGPRAYRTVGVRVVMTVRLPGNVDVTRGVLVNVPANKSPQDVIQAAVDWADRTNFGKPRNAAYAGTILTASIVQVVESTFSRPNVTVR